MLGVKIICAVSRFTYIYVHVEDRKIAPIVLLLYFLKSFYLPPYTQYVLYMFYIFRTVITVLAFWYSIFLLYGCDILFPYWSNWTMMGVWHEEKFTDGPVKVTYMSFFPQIIYVYIFKKEHKMWMSWFCTNTVASLEGGWRSVVIYYLYYSVYSFQYIWAISVFCWFRQLVPVESL